MGWSFGGFYTRIRKHWHSEVLRYGRRGLENSPFARVRFPRGSLSHISSHLTSALPWGPASSPYRSLDAQDETGGLLSVFCCQKGSRTESAINNACKHQLNLHSLSSPTLPFSALHFWKTSFLTVLTVCVSVLVRDGLGLRTKSLSHPVHQ